MQTSCVLVRPSFLKVLCKWASGASWTKCHDIQHKWCTYTIVQKWNTTKQTLSSSHRLLLRTLVLHVFVMGKRVGQLLMNELDRWLSVCVIQGQRPPTQFNQFAPSLKDPCHLSLMTRLWQRQYTWAFLGIPEIVYIIYVARSWQATACTKRLYQHLLVNFFGQY